MRRTTTKELHAKGYKRTLIKGLFVTNEGLCCNAQTNRELTPTKRGNVIIDGKAHNLAKLILATFKKQPVRSGQIVFKNGNTKDYSSDNLEYRSNPKIEPPKEADLITCIRLYFQVERKFNKRSFLFKYYLYEVIKNRGFQYRFKDKDFELFLEWSKFDLTNHTRSKYQLSLKHGYTATNGMTYINKYLGLLVGECLQDLQNGTLEVKDFQPKGLTQTQKLKALQTKIDESGYNIKVPLRKPSKKEQIKKAMNEIVKKQEKRTT
ncbi:hypothetical protein [Flavobacterium columnare]|uniref:hypothetical protein n=1 Tax=Flavobacterium columnare TaxID=996 RepID=UPI000D1BA125|nr:hypothetical protein [Flavobacterium columnare]PTD14380.1 hypothetical protein C6N29_07985 [Flavobacterium columnare]